MDGVEGMGPELIGTYSYLIDLIYARGGSTRRDDRSLGGRIGCTRGKAKKLTDRLIQLGKIVENGPFLTHKHAENHAKEMQKRSETNAKNGKKGGKKSGEVRKNNSLGEAVASSEKKQNRIDKKRYSDDDSAGEAFDIDQPYDVAPENANPAPLEPNARSKILEAIGVDTVSGIVGPTGKMIGMMTDMQEYLSWRDELGLSLDEVVTIIKEVMHVKRDGPPFTFTYFREAMRRAAGRKQQPALTPINGEHYEFGHKNGSAGADYRNQSGRSNYRSPNSQAHADFLGAFSRAVSSDTD